MTPTRKIIKIALVNLIKDRLAPGDAAAEQRD
jgi:hypothetical protein